MLTASDGISWPRKTRELHGALLDSSVWNEFRFRPDDVVIATYAKAGTTWTQQIVAQLIFGGREGVDVAALSPWLDLRIPPTEVKLALLEAQRHRRWLGRGGDRTLFAGCQREDVGGRLETS